MGYTKTIICLANSWKHTGDTRGRCVAGREYDRKGFGAWVRPVSARPTQEVSFEERRYKHWSDPEVLDVIKIAMSEPKPEGHQQENHVIDDSQRWEKVGWVDWDALQEAAEDPNGPLWTNDRSSSRGLNDGVLEGHARRLKRSLYLVRPVELVVSSGREPAYGGGAPKPKLRAHFKLGGYQYRLPVTDPVMYEKLPTGDTKLPEALLCVSLAAKPANDGHCYKLVATIITPERASKRR